MSVGKSCLHDKLKTHEVAYSKLHAGVSAIPRIGLNPYAIGMKLIKYAEELADKGKLTYDFQKIRDIKTRELYNKKTGSGREIIFKLRETFSDFMLINTFVDQDFVDKHSLFAAGTRLNPDKRVVEVYVKSKKAGDYKQMLLDKLYHPPEIRVDKGKTDDSNLYLVHNFEGKELLKDYIPNTMLGIEFLWGGQVQLETTEIEDIENPDEDMTKFIKNSFGIPILDIGEENLEPIYKRVVYTMKDRKISKKDL